MAKRTQTRTRVTTRKQSGRKRSAKVTMMPLVIKTSPDDTQGVIRAAVDDSTGAPRAVIPVAVKGKKTVKRRAAVIPVSVKTLPQPRPIITRSKLRPEAENPTSLRSAAIGIADELIEAEKNMFRLGFHYLKAMTSQVANTLIGRPMTRFEEEIQATQFAAPSEHAMRVTLSRAA